MREDSQPGPTHPPHMAFDAARVLRASKFRLGNLRAQGVPAILIGAAAVIVAVGAARSLRAATPLLPETLREARNLLEATRREPKTLGK
jgi:hypothetical protein